MTSYLRRTAWRKATGLQDARLDHSLPVAVTANNLNALRNPRHVGRDHEIGRAAARTLAGAVERLFRFLARDPMMPVLLALLGALACVPTHANILRYDSSEATTSADSPAASSGSSAAASPAASATWRRRSRMRASRPTLPRR